MRDLVVDVPPILNRFRDALAQQGLDDQNEAARTHLHLV